MFDEIQLNYQLCARHCETRSFSLRSTRRFKTRSANACFSCNSTYILHRDKGKTNRFNLDMDANTHIKKKNRGRFTANVLNNLHSTPATAELCVTLHVKVENVIIEIQFWRRFPLSPSSTAPPRGRACLCTRAC